jgi:molybdenum-dependent DNA-binding transcriptional regulator ModE
VTAHPGRDVRMDELAAWMAEHGGRVRDAAKALGWNYDATKHVWQRIRKRLGAQAS